MEKVLLKMNGTPSDDTQRQKSDRRGTKVGINLLFVYNGEEGCERMKKISLN